MWEAALHSFAESPILGNGFFVGQKQVMSADTGGLLSTTDSTYVETLVNLGILGITSIGCFVVVAALSTWVTLRRATASSNASLITSMQLFVLVFFAIARSFTSATYESLTYNVIYILVALVGVRLVSQHAPAAEPTAARASAGLGSPPASQLVTT